MLLILIIIIIIIIIITIIYWGVSLVKRKENIIEIQEPLQCLKA